uniref:SH2 domain-containing protein n=1 Tax=Syphacia muris TaxID=451379 RepID=A0A0N5AEK2_9BILA
MGFFNKLGQVFKDDTDVLLSGKVTASESNQLVTVIVTDVVQIDTNPDTSGTLLFLYINQFKYKPISNSVTRILQTTVELCRVLEDEKQYLMGDVLYKWAVRQQKLSIGTLWTQQQHYFLLDNIHQQFEYFGELLEQTMSGIRYLVERCYHEEFESLYTKLQQLAHYFLYYSVIVAKQPPSVVVKCGEAENHRRSRFWFNTEIRVLGGQAFNVKIDTEGSEVSCYLITDETAKQLLCNAYHDVFVLTSEFNLLTRSLSFSKSENEEFVIEPPHATFHYKENHGFKACFDDMPNLDIFGCLPQRTTRVAKKSQLRRDSVATKRYCLCYNIQLKASHGITLVGKKVSLPFAILVGPKTDVEARLFLERSFADLVRKPLSDIPEVVTYSEMADALEMKFQAIVETPQRSTDGMTLTAPRVLTDQDKEHIILRLKPNVDGTIHLERFLKQPVCQEYITKKSSTDGEWKLVAFFDWFFKLGEIVNKYLYQMWNDGLIYGFCGKDDAEALLRQCSRPTLLIRFSDVEYGKIKISVLHNGGVLQHHWYDYTDLNARSLQNELLTNHTFSDVEFIYPSINLEVALGGRQKPRNNRKPRILNPTPIYFDNQCAATSPF